MDYKAIKALGIRYSRVHIDRLEAAGSFPASFKLGGAYHNSPRVWWEDEVLRWLEACSKR